MAAGSYESKDKGLRAIQMICRAGSYYVIAPTRRFD